MNNSDNINEKKKELELYELYDHISEENEQVASFLECLLKKKRQGKDLNSTTELEKLIRNKSLKLTVAEMYKKFKDFGGKNDKLEYIDSDDDDVIYNDGIVMDIRELTSDQRKLLLFFYVILYAPINSYNYEKDWLSIDETFKITDKDVIKKLSYCNLYAPYKKYAKSVPAPGFKNYIYFNWDSLIKLNMNIFSNLEVDNTDNDNYFKTLHGLVIELRHMISCFKSNDYPSKNKYLFDRFVKLQQRFPEIYEEYLILEDKDFELE